MNILIDRLPETVEIGGVEWPIETNFRTSILYELLMQDDTVSDVDKAVNALRLYFPSIPPDLQAASEKIIWFYSCGKPPKKKTKHRTAKTESGEDTKLEDGDEEEENRKPSGERIYSFEHDAPHIYAAFMEQYGIDLADIEYMHWWKFRALFDDLNPETHFMKILEYRGMEITSKMTDEQKRYYRKMKKVYALPLSEAEEEQQDALIDALLNGKDLSGIL